MALPAGFTAAAASSAAAPMSYYQSSGVRKAVLLARYTDMLQGWYVDGSKCKSMGQGTVRPRLLAQHFEHALCTCDVPSHPCRHCPQAD